MKTKNILKRLLPLLMVLCILLSSCVTTLPDGNSTTGTTGEESPVTPDDPTNPGDGTPDDDPTPGPCTHTRTELRGQLEATCAKAGYTGDTVCSDCGELIERGTEIPATLDHTWDNGVVTRDPTCISEGVLTKTCTVCTATTEVSVATVAHKDIYHDALDGTHTHTCGTCTAVNSNEAHVPVDADGTYYAATCQSAGYTEYVCSLCEQAYKVTDVNAPILEHAYGNWTTEPSTCSLAGRQYRTCGNTDCNHTEEITLPLDTTEHNYIESSTTASTCLVAGETLYICDDCHAEKTETLPLLSHIYVDDTSETEAASGWTHLVCDRGCGQRISSYDASNDLSISVNTAEIPADKPFEVKMQEASIEFPADVVSQMKESGESIAIEASILGDKTSLLEQSSNLTEQERLHLESAPVYDFSAGSVSASFNSKVKVTVPYTLRKGEDNPEAIIIWYLDDSDPDNVTLRKVNATYADGSVTFEVEHFSYYAIAYEETQEMKCKRGLHSYTLQESISATCYSNGYDVHVCVCGKTMYDNHVSMTGHSYGAVQIPTVTCDQGGYKTMACQNDGCTHVVQLEYVRALGHQPDQVATCTEPSTCTVCHNVITPALGHRWSSWEVVVPATEISAGLQRRHCAGCGTKEEVRLAPTGSITAIDFDSYQEMLEAIVFDFLGLQNGTFTFRTSMNSSTVDLTVTVSEENGSRMMLIEGTTVMVENDYDAPNYSDTEIKDPVTVQPTSTVTTVDGVIIDGVVSDGTISGGTISGGTISGGTASDSTPKTETFTFRVLYRNGIVIFSEGTDGAVTVSDIESFMTALFENMTFEVLEAFLKDVFESNVNPQVEMTFAQANAMLEEFISLYGDRIDLILSKAGLSYTAEELAEVLDAAQSLYAYAALKLGYSTNLEMSEGIEIPTAAQLATLLGAFCQVSTDADGNVTYSLNGKTEYEAAMEVLSTWLDGHLEMPLSDFLYELLGEELVKTYPELTSWAAVEEMIRTKFPATLTVGELVDRIITIVEASEVCTLDELYMILNALLAEMTGESTEEIDIESMLQEYEDLTLDELSTEIFKSSLDDFYNDLSEMLSGTLLGEIEIEGATIANMADMLEQYAAMIDLQSAGFELTISENGDLIFLSIDLSVAMRGEDEDEESTPLFNLFLEVDSTASVTIEIPSEMVDIDGNRVTYTYDKDGNLIVSGLNSEIDYEISINDNVWGLELSELVEYDAEMSARYGYDIYRLKDEFCRETANFATYFRDEDGNLYTYHSEWLDSYRELVSAVKLSEVLSNWQLLLPEDGAEWTGMFNGLPVYTSPLGPIYQDESGTWNLICKELSDYYYTYDSETEVQYIVYSDVLSVPLADAVATLEISSYDDNGYWKSDLLDANGNKLANETMLNFHIYAFDKFVGYSILVSVPVYIENNEVLLLTIKEHSSRDVYVLGELVTELPEYDTSSNSISIINREILNADGSVSDKTFTYFHLYRLVPTYYAYYDGFYFSDYTSVFETVNDITAVTDREVILPDNRVLYVIGTEYFETTYQMGDVTLTHAEIGYLHVKDNIYVRAVAYYDQTGSFYDLSYCNDWGSNAGTTQYWSGSISDLINVESFDLKWENGNLIIPVELLDAIRAHLNSEGEGFSIMIGAEYTVGDVSVMEMYLVGAEMILPDVSSSSSSSSSLPYIEVYEWFQESEIYPPSYDNGYSITLDENGNPVITLADSSTSIDLSVYFNGDITLPIPTDRLTYNAEKSESAGFDLYSFSRYYESFHQAVLADGVYYEYYTDSTYYASEYLEADTPEEIFSKCWSLCDLTLFIAKTDTAAAFYQAAIEFNENRYGWYSPLNVWLQIENGTVYALTGAVAESDTVVRYEDRMPISEYLASLTFEEDYSSIGSNYFMPDGTTPLDYVTFSVYEGDNHLGTVSMRTYETADGQRKYVALQEETCETYLTLSTKAYEGFVPSGESYESTYENGVFTIVYGSVTHETENVYIMIADTLYLFEDSYGDYYSTTFWDAVIYESDSILELPCTVINDTTRFYAYDDSMSSGYLAIDTAYGATYYLEAGMETDENGNTKLICYYLTQAKSYVANETETEELFASTLLYSGNSVTLTPEFLALFGNQFYDVSFDVYACSGDFRNHLGNIAGYEILNLLNPDGSDDRDKVENYREEILQELEYTWKELSGYYNISSTQVAMYNKYLARLQQAETIEEIDNCYALIGKLFDEIASSNDDEENDYVLNIIFSGGEPTTTVGADITEFLEKFVLGQTLTVEMSASGTHEIVITKEMILAVEGDTSAVGNALYIRIDHGLSHVDDAYVLYVPVMADMDGTTFLGAYDANCIYNNMEGIDVIIELYDNGYANLCMTANGDTMIQQMTFTMPEDGVLVLDLDGVNTLFALDNEAMALSIYQPSGDVVGIYSYNAEYISHTYTVYGPYTGAGNYVALLEMNSEGMQATIAIEIYLDIENCRFESQTIGNGPFTFDESGNLFCDHQYFTNTCEPTCTSDGWTETYCDYCGDYLYEIIPAYGHNFVDGICEHCGANENGDSDEVEVLRNDLLNWMNDEWNYISEYYADNLIDEHYAYYNDLLEAVYSATENWELEELSAAFGELLNDIYNSEGGDTETEDVEAYRSSIIADLDYQWSELCNNYAVTDTQINRYKKYYEQIWSVSTIEEIDGFYNKIQDIFNEIRNSAGGDTCTHNYITERSDPTCDMYGHEKTYCLLCGEVTYDVELAPFGHSFVDGVCQNCYMSENGDITEGEDVEAYRSSVISNLDSMWNELYWSGAYAVTENQAVQYEECYKMIYSVATIEEIDAYYSKIQSLFDEIINSGNGEIVVPDDGTTSDGTEGGDTESEDVEAYRSSVISDLDSMWNELYWSGAYAVTENQVVQYEECYKMIYSVATIEEIDAYYSKIQSLFDEIINSGNGEIVAPDESVDTNFDSWGAVDGSIVVTPNDTATEEEKTEADADITDEVVWVENADGTVTVK